MTFFVGEVRMFGGDYAPNGWLLCDGSLQLIANYENLFQLFGTAFGGDDKTFGLPDLRGRVPIGADPSHPHAEKGGKKRSSSQSRRFPGTITMPSSQEMSPTAPIRAAV